jgi:hypothetical protein
MMQEECGGILGIFLVLSQHLVGAGKKTQNVSDRKAGLSSMILSGIS